MDRKIGRENSATLILGELLIQVRFDCYSPTVDSLVVTSDGLHM